MTNINDCYFDGHYKDIWRSIIPNILTTREVEFMLSYFNLQPGNKVLDLMCGYGRHAIALARNRIHVTAVDNLADYIEEIERVANEEQLCLKSVKENIIAYQATDTFDLVICMGNSLNFFNETDTIKILFKASSILKQNGQILINTWSLEEIVKEKFKEKSSSRILDLKFNTNSKFFFQPNRIETETSITTTDGKVETKIAIDYIFSIPEMETMLNKAGFVLKEIYSIPGRKKFTIGEPRAYIICNS
jgi:cyclopropane fatty-acyl-phospholipid synthase-like methyltransferase